MFVTFEGIEGSGKSTQARHLARRLRDMSVPILLTREPGGSRVGMEIRNILLDSRNACLNPLAELLLYLADRAQHVDEIIRPAIERGDWVICDRFSDATEVYQGHVRGLDRALIREMNLRACNGIRPQMTFLLDCPISVGLARARRRIEASGEENQDRFEKEGADFHEAVRKGYLLAASEAQDRFVVLDGTQSEDHLEALVFGHVEPHIDQYRSQE